MVRTSHALFGPDALFDHRYYAPAGLFAQSSDFGGVYRGSSLIMPHEAFVGILPRKEQISEINFYYREPKGRKRTMEIETAGGGTKRVRMPYAQNVANYKFFIQRFGSRTLTASGPFNPHPVCGFPALLVDVPDFGEAISPQFVGMLAAMSHTISQTPSGSTSYTMTHARTHDGRDDEFMRYISVVEKIRTEPAQTTYNYEDAKKHRNTDHLVYLLRVAKNNPRPLRVGEKGPRNGVITKIQANSYALVDVQNEVPTAAIMAFGDPGRGIEHLDVPVAMTVTEEVLVSGGEILVPFEDTIRPPWMSDIFSSEKIGRMFYQDVIGTWSIVDDIVAIGPEGEISSSMGTGSVESPERPSTKLAAEHLASLYAKLRQLERDTAQFASQYVGREIATLRDILGDGDVTWSEAGKPQTPDGRREVVVGFHGPAVAPLDNLKGLPGANKKLSRFGLGEKLKAVSARLDPRLERRRAVEEYLDDVYSSRLGG